MNRKKIFFWSVFYILLFIGGYFLGEVLFFKQALPSETVLYSPPPVVSKVETANTLRQKYITGLWFHDDIHKWEQSMYLTTKKSILDAYNNGDRSADLMRAYIYLVAQEGDFWIKEKLIKEFCTTDQICREFMADILITWVVKTPQWDSIPGATVEVLGTTYKTISNNKGEYTLSFQHISPAVLRIRASAPNKMLWIHRIDVADHTVSSERIQSFEKGFTLAKAFTEISIDTLQKTIVGEGTSITEKGFLIITPYTKYLIPFNAIVKGDTPYKWKLKALIFEFDRQSSSYLLNADIFDQVSGLISQTLVTYGMPFVILTAENGARLDVLDTNPMTVWTTDRASRETENQLLDKETKSLFENAYQLSQSSPDEYPINSLWEYTNGNKKIVPLFWVFDRATGYWDNVGMRFVTNNFTAPYNIEAHFYTLRSQKK